MRLNESQISVRAVSIVSNAPASFETPLQFETGRAAEQCQFETGRQRAFEIATRWAVGGGEGQSVARPAPTVRCGTVYLSTVEPAAGPTGLGKELRVEESRGERG